MWLESTPLFHTKRNNFLNKIFLSHRCLLLYCWPSHLRLCYCFKPYPLTSSFLQVRTQSPVENMVILSSPSPSPAKRGLLLPPRLRHLPPLPDELLTGSRDLGRQPPVPGEFPSRTERLQRHSRIKLQPGWSIPPSTEVVSAGWSWPLTSQLEAEGGHAPILPAFQVFPVYPPVQGPSGVSAARMATPAMELYVKVESLAM